MKKITDDFARERSAASEKMLFVFPTEAEAAPFRRLCPCAQTAVSGVGAAQTAVGISRFLQQGYRNLVLAGIAGAYGDKFSKGDVVEVCEERLAGMPALYARSYRPQPLSAIGRSPSGGHSAAAESSAANDLRIPDARSASGGERVPQAIANTVTVCGAAAGGADIENMEGAVFFALCEEYGAASREIRAVSNRVGEPRGEWDTELALRRLAETLNRLYEYEQD